MKDITRYFTLVGGVIALLIFCYVQGFILVSDIVLTILFVVVAFIEFGATWRHRKWSAQTEPAKERIRWWLSKIYWTATICTILVPLLSLGSAYVLRVQAPQHVDGAMARIVTQPPANIPIVTLNGVSVPSASATGSYVSVFKPASQDISLAAPVLQKVFGDIDMRWRVSFAWVCAVFIALILFMLFCGEMFADVSISGTTTGIGATGGSGTNPVITPTP
jgi:hypothetical protein